MRGLGIALLLLPLSGCLADDVWREPFSWNEVAAEGENVEAAQAFGALFGDAPARAGDAGDVVISTVDDVPDTVVFQNFKEFVNRQAPGRGDEIEQNVRVVTGGVRDNYTQLSGQVAQAWEDNTGEFAQPSIATTFTVADRTTRMRITIDVALEQGPPEEGTNRGPLGNVDIILIDPDGEVREHYLFDTSRHMQDMFIVGTYGGANAVYEHFGGEWSLDVSATGTGAWSVQIEAYEPVHEDYSWWQFWRADKREVAGE